MREIKISLFLSHPNLLSLYGCFSDQSSIYLITELASDNSLYDTISRGDGAPRVLPAELVKSYVGQLCSALKYLHQNMVLHRDVKP